MEEQEGQYEELEKGTELTINRAATRAYRELRQELGEALYDLVILEDEQSNFPFPPPGATSALVTCSSALYLTLEVAERSLRIKPFAVTLNEGGA